jgi:hypothetical protein
MPRTGFAVTGAATDTALVAAPGAGKHLRILYLQFTVSAAAIVSVSDGADATGTRLFYGDCGANAGFVGEARGAGDSSPWMVLTGNTALNITNSAGNLKGVVEYEIG